ncbi:MAG: diacylglycerol kinase family protein [Patescibacteria group bacterium]|jgi:diacylglycerol kinase family enzyme
MYLYIYDSFLNDKKYTDLLIKIEKRLTDLGIKGKIARLSILKNMKELITDGVKEGVETVVAIGNAQTFAKVINVVADLDVALGLIPIDNNNELAKALGIPPKVLACDVLASRIIKKIDLGKINNYYFVNTAHIENGDVTIEYKDFKISPITEKSKITLYNFASEFSNSSPVDGVLEAVITPIQSGVFGKKKINQTILPFTKIKIGSQAEEQVAILTDEQIIMKTPAEIKVIPQKLKIIVGSDRHFE